MVRVLTAARAARDFLASARFEQGLCDLPEWPEVRRARTRPNGRRVDAAVVRLRIAQRLLVGFLDPVQDAVFVTAGLRRLGIPATFHLGREIAPAAPPAAFYAWVEFADRVVSTTLPVGDEYVEIYRSKASGSETS